MFTTILMDLDDTLLDFRKSEAESLCLTLKELGISPSEEIAERFSRINDSMWKRLELGEMTRDEVKSRRFEELFSYLGVNADIFEARRLYETAMSKSAFFLDGALELLDALHGKYRLYLVSNGSAEIQKGRLAISGIEKYFDKIFVSEAIGFNKPSARFFELCFAQIENFKKEETIIFGDSLTSDIKGGNNAGIAACWFNPRNLENKGTAKANFEIKKHSQFLEIL